MDRTNYLIFDIETGPHPDLANRIPPFDPSKVKMGNIKDPDKRAQKLAEAQVSHREDYMSDAALRAQKGVVVAIGIYTTFLGAGESLLHNKPEAQLLEDLSGHIRTILNTNGVVVGFNSHGFDIPFCRRRCMALGVRHLEFWPRKGRYYDPNYIDLLDEWGPRDPSDRISLKGMCQMCGIDLGEKEDMRGDQFAPMYANGGEDRMLALEYLSNDIRITRELALHVGAVEED